MKKTKTKAKPEHESTGIVDQYNESEDALKDFSSDPAVREILEELHSLTEARNSALDAAIRAVKSELQRSEGERLVVGGIGAQKKYKRYYDAKYLAENLPVGQFLLFAKERLEYDIDTAVLDQLLRQGEVDQDIVRGAYHNDEQSPSSMPGTPKPYMLPPIPLGD